MNADPIPTVTEAEATGETAALFAELRATLGIPLVNLIWRHLATIPGGLAWTWTLLRPIYLSPDLAAAAQELHSGIALPIHPIPAFVYDTLGLDQTQRAAIASLIAGYDRGNSLNFLALTVACRVLRNETPSHTPAPTPLKPPYAPPPASSASTPRLLGLDELSPPLHALVMDLDQFGRIAPSDAVASLYRHLAQWPALLALAHTALAPLHHDGTLRTQQQHLIARAAPLIATRLEPLLQAIPPALAPAEQARVLAGLDEFTRLMIGRMVVIGTALGALLPPDAKASA